MKQIIVVVIQFSLMLSRIDYIQLVKQYLNNLWWWNICSMCQRNAKRWQITSDAILHVVVTMAWIPVTLYMFFVFLLNETKFSDQKESFVDYQFHIVVDLRRLVFITMVQQAAI